MKQQPLFDPGPAIEGLTDRQRRILESIPRDGITAYEAGKLLGASDMFARSNGIQVLTALKKRGLVVERRNPTRYELARSLKPEPPTVWPAGF